MRRGRVKEVGEDYIVVERRDGKEVRISINATEPRRYIILEGSLEGDGKRLIIVKGKGSPEDIKVGDYVYIRLRAFRRAE